MGLLLVILLVLLLVGGLPGVAIQHDYGYYPSGLAFLLLVVLVVLLVGGRL